MIILLWSPALELSFNLLNYDNDPLTGKWFDLFSLHCFLPHTL